MVHVIGCYGASDASKFTHTHVYDYAINMMYVVTGYTNKAFNYANKNFPPNR